MAQQFCMSLSLFLFKLYARQIVSHHPSSTVQSQQIALLSFDIPEFEVPFDTVAQKSPYGASPVDRLCHQHAQPRDWRLD